MDERVINSKINPNISVKLPNLASSTLTKIASNISVKLSNRASSTLHKPSQFLPTPNLPSSTLSIPNHSIA